MVLVSGLLSAEAADRPAMVPTIGANILCFAGFLTFEVLQTANTAKQSAPTPFQCANASLNILVAVVVSVPATE